MGQSMRRYGQPVAVTVAGDDAPQAFAWRGRTHRVAVIASWRIETDWWADDHPIRRTYYRVVTGGHEVFEIYRDDHDAAAHVWVLERCYD